VRRRPIVGGQIAYHAQPCEGAAAASLAGNAGAKLGARYFSCAAGAACRKTHSLIEILYHPVGGFRRRSRELRSGLAMSLV
jgi:hypothetical protein